MAEAKELFEPWVRIACTGTFKDSSGREHSFTNGNFDEIVANYNPETEESPIVFGHPKDNQPARGWIKGLKRENNILFAQLSQISAEAVESVQKGDYRYVSMSLHPCGKRLRHVGLLGAVPPAITGLGPVLFSTSDELTISFSVSTLGPEAETEGGKIMDKEFQEMLAELNKQVAELLIEVQKLTGEKSELQQEAENSKKSAEETQASFSAYKAEVETSARKGRLEKLTADGKVLPAEHEHINALVSALSKTSNGDTVNFSSATGIEKITPEEAYWRELEARPTSDLTQNFSTYIPPEQTNQAASIPGDINNKL